jgi:tetratricopeptide (TPR) repeat protein
LPDYISVSEHGLIENKGNSRRQIWLLVLLVLLAFGRIGVHGFTNWDDDKTIAFNPDFNPPTLAGISRYWHEADRALYIPVTYTIWGGLSYLSDIGSTLATPNPWLFHCTSVLIHLFSALLVYALLVRLFCNSTAAFFGAAVFALHPIQVESVAWASGMKDLLCGMFSLLALLQYVQFVQERKRFSYLLALIALVLASLSKPTAIITPLLALIIDHWLLNRPWRSIIRSLWPWFLAVIPIAIIARLVQPTQGTPLTSLWSRPLIYTDAMAFYLGKIFWPFHLALDYARTPVYAMQQHWIYWTWIFPAAAAVIVFIFRKNRYLIAGALLFLAGWLPVSGLAGFMMQYFSTVADHYLYLPMLGVAVIIAGFIANHPIALRPFTLLLTLLTLLTFIQSGYWGTDEKLYRHTLAVSPRSYVAYTNLAMNVLGQDRPEEAETLLTRATQINPDYFHAWELLAELLAQRGKIDQAIVAEEHAMNSRQFLPSHGGASYPAQLDLFGQLLIKQHRTAEAIHQFQHALQIDPNYTAAKDHLAQAQRSQPTP